jgi:hypothetical protein
MTRLIGGGVGFTDWDPPPDPLEPGAIVPGELGGITHPQLHNARDASGGAVQTGDALLVSDSVAVFNGTKVGDRGPVRIRVVPRNRAGRFAKSLERRRGWVWSTPTPADITIVQGGAAMSADSGLTASGTAVVPNEQDGVLAIVANAAMTMAAGMVPGGVAAQLVATSSMAAAAASIQTASCVMAGDSTLFAQGTGGSTVAKSTDRRGGIVSIGIRGGHS